MDLNDRLKKLDGLLNVWGGGQLLAYSGIDGATDYNHGLVLRTSPSCFGLDVKIPSDGTIAFGQPTPPGKILLGGDFFIFDGGTTKGVFLDAHHLLIEGKCRIERDMDNVSYSSEGNRTLVGTKKFFNPSLLHCDMDSEIVSRSKWLMDAPVPEKLPATGRRTLYKAFSQMKTQVCGPEGRIRHRWTTPDRWPHRQMWLWDSVFHAVGFMHCNIGLARDAISSIFDVQKEDGMIPHMMNPYSSSDITQPPIIAFGAGILNKAAPSRDWISGLYPKLKKYILWDLANRDSDGAGLCEWFIEGDVNCRCGESGLDNSPRFDCAARLDATDFNSYLALECENMAEFAKICGMTDDVSFWTEHKERICNLINSRLWSEEKGFYLDYNLKDGVQSDILAVSGFLPLICGAPSASQAGKLVAHLANPETFGTQLRVPSIARTCGSHYSKDMWRGPTWISTNWLIIHGLRRYGYLREAEKLRRETVAAIEEMYGRYGTFFEFYDDRMELDPPHLLRKGLNAPEISPTHQVIFDYGWTATLYVDMVLSGSLH